LVQSTRDPNGSIDYGNIDVLNVTDGSFILVGNFGSVNIKGGVLQFEVHT